MSAILIVEDCDEIRIDLAELLRDEGYEVVTARHGAEAIALLDSGLQPALILLDLMMPVMDGWQFRKEQLEKPVLAPIPVVLLTGAGNAQKHARDLKAVGCVQKPFDLEDLLGAVSEHCSRAHAPVGEAAPHRGDG
jgi:CheY-like chemotaxis protein